MFQRHVDTLDFFHLLQTKNECTVRIQRTLLRIEHELIFIVSYLKEKKFINSIFLSIQIEKGTTKFFALFIVRQNDGFLKRDATNTMINSLTFM